MATYRYEAMNQSGQEVKDTIEADSSEGALAKIRNMGYFPTRIREEKAATIPILVAVEEEPNVWLRRAVVFGPVALLLICVGLFLIPLSYMWNHEDLTTLQVVKANWKSTLGGTVIFMLLSLWVKLRKWVKAGCP